MPKFRINCTVLDKEYNVTIEARTSAEAQNILVQKVVESIIINSNQEITKSKDFNIEDIFNFLK